MVNKSPYSRVFPLQNDLYKWFIKGGYILTTYVRPGVILQEGIEDPGEQKF